MAKVVHDRVDVVVARDASSAATITAVDEAWDQGDHHGEVDTVASIRTTTIRMDRNSHAVCHRAAVVAVLASHAAEDGVARGHGMTSELVAATTTLSRILLPKAPHKLHSHRRHYRKAERILHTQNMVH